MQQGQRQPERQGPLTSSCRGPPAGAARLPLQPSPRPRHWKLGPFRAEPQLQTRQLSLPIGSPIFSTEHCPPAPVFFFLFLSSHSPSSQFFFFTSHDDTQVSWKNSPKRNKTHALLNHCPSSLLALFPPAPITTRQLRVYRYLELYVNRQLGTRDHPGDFEFFCQHLSLNISSDERLQDAFSPEDGPPLWRFSCARKAIS